MKKIVSIAMLIAVGGFMMFMECPDGDGLVPPTGLTATGTTDEMGILLEWTAAADADGYNIYFDGTLIQEDVIVTEYSHANPGGVGTYEVTSAAGNDESEDAASISTEPLDAATLEVDEINGPDESGIGWSALGTGSIAKYTMGTGATTQDEVCFYYTDFETGTIELARALEVETDPGVGWDVGTGWRNGGVSTPLADDFDNVTSVATSGYENYNEPTVNATQAVWIDAGGGDGYYGLIETISINDPDITCRVTFQTIMNFVYFQ